MKQLFDFIPLLVFFALYKLYDIYVATAALMVVTLLQMAFIWFRHGKLEKMHWVTLVLILVFGGFTLLLH
ncbi:MAG: septation protein IspZ, partial [Aeromonadaceae bacterium]|nr:septation protein IspZ [Aeromonadaceae bacterium]